METVTLPVALVQQIAAYLVQRPYGEVAVLLSAMQEAVMTQQPAATAELQGKTADQYLSETQQFTS